MRQRPLPVTLISILLMLLGTGLLIALLLEKPDPDQPRRVAEFKAQHSFQYQVEQYFPHMAVEVWTIICGVLLFFGVNTGRWLFVLWMLFHLFIGFLNSPMSVFVHGLIFATFLYFLFNRKSSAYFRSTQKNESDT